MKLYLFDDRVCEEWAPFALTRPCSELLFGAYRQRERLERFAGRPASGCLTRPWLADFHEPAAPPAVAEAAAISHEEDRLFLSSRLVPDISARFAGCRGRTVLLADQTAVGCFVPAGEASPEAEWFACPVPRPGWTEAEVAARSLGAVWDLITENAEQTSRDLTALLPIEREAPAQAWVVGDGPITVGRGVRLEPGTLFDTRAGPVLLRDDVEVRTGARLAGPLVVGSGSIILGGSLTGVSVGPNCRLRGEIEASVVLGFSNKAHDGFLGHSYVGSWVNLGAGTTNSDLKNNYGPVRAGGPAGESDTGLLKLGCLLGDHVKTGIGTLFNTGTRVGAGSNLFGVGIPPKWIPPFSWGNGAELVAHRREAFLETARAVMARRGVSFDGKVRRWLSAVYDAGRGGLA